MIRSKLKRRKLRVRYQLSDAQKAARLIRVRGQMHHKAILTDRDVDLVLELRSAGWLYREIAAKMEASKSTIKDICKGLTRARCG